MLHPVGAAYDGQLDGLRSHVRGRRFVLGVNYIAKPLAALADLERHHSWRLGLCADRR